MNRLLAAMRSRAARWAFGLVAAALAVWAVAGSWGDVREAIKGLQPGLLLAAAAATLANMVVAALGWRAILTDLGARLPLRAALRVFFVGQLGKYIPGGVWQVVAQAEMASTHGVDRRRAATSTVVNILMSVLGALLVALVCLPALPSSELHAYRWAVVLAVPLLAVLHPAVLERLLRLGIRMLRRDADPHTTSLRGTLVAMAWVLASWVAAGLQVWALAIALGARANLASLALATGGFALAWALGLLVVMAPAGAGVREVVLGAALSGLLDRGEVIVLVLVSRTLFALGDVGLAGLFFLGGRPSGKPRHARAVGEAGGVSFLAAPARRPQHSPRHATVVHGVRAPARSYAADRPDEPAEEASSS